MECILLADDSKEIRDTLRRIFLEEGFAFCVKAANGKEVVEEAKRMRPDISNHEDYLLHSVIHTKIYFFDCDHIGVRYNVADESIDQGR